MSTADPTEGVRRSGNPEPPRGSRPRSRKVLVGATVGAVAVLLLVSIVVFGILGPRFQLFGRPGNSGHPVTFAQAESASDGVAAGHPGGPWNLTSVNGYSSRQGYTWSADRAPPPCHPPWAQPAIAASDGPLLVGKSSSYREFC